MNEKAMELLKIFDLTEKRGQPASSLPYGKQRASWRSPERWQRIPSCCCWTSLRLA